MGPDSAEHPGPSGDDDRQRGRIGLGDAKRQSAVEEAAGSIHSNARPRNGVWKHVAAAVPEEHEVGERLDIGCRDEEVCNIRGVLQEIRGGRITTSTT